MSTKITGGCQCGAVRYRTESLGRPSICHCRMCQKAFGAFYGPLVTAHGRHRGFLVEVCGSEQNAPTHLGTVEPLRIPVPESQPSGPARCACGITTLAGRQSWG